MVTAVNTMDVGREAGSPSGTLPRPTRRSLPTIGAMHATAHLAPHGNAEAERHWLLINCSREHLQGTLGEAAGCKGGSQFNSGNNLPKYREWLDMA